jgi:hypothetical protein
MKESKTSGTNDVFGPVIYAYTRAQAIEDGVLVDVSETAHEAGIKLPTVVTAAVHAEYVAVPEELKSFQDEAGRLWDILWMCAVAIRSGEIQGSEGIFQLIVATPETTPWRSNEKRHEGSKTQRLVTLKAVCGPADDGSPCITILRPEED